MSILRRIASRVCPLENRSLLRLRQLGRSLKAALKAKTKANQEKITRQCWPWIDKVQRFFLLEGSQPLPRSLFQAGSTVNRVASPTETAKRSASARLKSAGSINRTGTILLLAVLLLTTCLGQRFYNQPGLDIKSVSPQTFYAPESATVEDKGETENLRNSVRSGSLQVLKIDPELTAAAERSLETRLRQGRELRKQAGSSPLVDLDAISKPAQDSLFQAQDTEWQRIWHLAERLSSAQVPAVKPAASAPLLPAQTEIEVRSLGPDQTAALQELVVYRERSGNSSLALLKDRMDSRRAQYRKAVTDLATIPGSQPLYNYRLFELSDDQWATLEKDTRQIFKEMMQQGIHQGVPPDLLRRAIEARVPSPMTPASQLTADMLAGSIAPNLALDEARTRLRAEQAVRQIDPVMISVQKGDLIVLANETIDPSEFVLLDHFDLTGRYFNWVGLCGFSLLVAAAIALYLWVDHRQTHPLNQRDHFLVLLLCLVAAALAALRVPTLGLPAVGLLVGSFYGWALGMTVVALLALILPIGTAVTTIPLMAGAAAAMVGTWFAPQLRSREEFALLGGFVGLSQASGHLILTLMRSTVATPLWQAMFVGSAMHGLYGIVWSVVALGVSPYLEHFFDVVTPIRLAELSNPNRLLLKRLAAEAPGTFQHTMFVANLAEAAARALGRNVELVRAGTLYHDIGKMHDPQSFIENQISGPNKHDVMDDPWKSASIIKKHVTLGLVMARKHRLPKAVQAFIPEHQGDMKISYFYQQAKARQAAEPSLVIDESDFRYDGPIPQSPETGITMLADSCEAALRSLKPEASIDEAYAMVNKIFRARWRNRQLIDSGLSRADMDVIASVFIQVWQQHNHKRISYPRNMLGGTEARSSKRQLTE